MIVLKILQIFIAQHINLKISGKKVLNLCVVQEKFVDF